MARLLSHQMGTVLTPVNTLIGWAKYRLQHPEGGLDTTQVIDFIKQAEDMTMVLANSARETLQGRVLNIKNEDLKEAEDYKFERYPLSVLVSNCANSFAERARLNRRDLVVEANVERLPDADVDVARLTIVLANLIDNAIKYSLPDSKIYVRAHLNTPGSIENATAVIEIDDLGLGIRVDEEDNIFTQGSRGEMAKKAGIVGSGFGLWEADMIVKAHGGKIMLKHWPIQFPHREGQHEHIVFGLEIPIIHKK
jgi:signal transduction histidine kinase